MPHAACKVQLLPCCRSFAPHSSEALLGGFGCSSFPVGCRSSRVIPSGSFVCSHQFLATKPLREFSSLSWPWPWCKHSISLVSASWFARVTLVIASSRERDELLKRASGHRTLFVLIFLTHVVCVQVLRTVTLSAWHFAIPFWLVQVRN